jgi:putative MATE family efflux protein
MAHGLGEASTATIARRIGEKSFSAATRAAAQALALGSSIAILAGVAGALSAGRILAWMGASPSVASAGVTYAAITLGGSIALFFVLIGNSILRGAGDAALALRCLWLANGLNVVLDPILIFGLGPIPALGLTGAAVASVIGWGIAGLYQIRILSRGRGRLRIRRADLAIDRKVTAGLVRLAVPATMDNLLGSASYLALFRIVAIFGSPVLAAFTVCTRLFMLAESPSWGFANAAATLVGQNLGAGNSGRAERTAWRVAFYNMLIQGTIGALYMIFAVPLMRLFTAEPEVIAAGVSCLLWVGAGYALYGCGQVISQSLSGAGDTVTPAIANAVAMWLCQIPLAYGLSVTLGFGPQGVFAALLASESLLALTVVAVFRRGSWKRKRI